ncbi:MAG TPA: tail fiber protein [Candidatus Methylomirabilis sp.]|nr:tail fiber protein [Candidatus Methylomirabilis sp.]
MAEPFLSEIRICSFNFAPKGWALCNGQLLPINQNQALFALLGTTYGGDGRVNFALPDLRSRTPIHFDNSHSLGERAGEEGHTLSAAEMPQHAHNVQGTSDQGTSLSPGGNVLASKQRRAPNYYAPQATTALHPATVSVVGGQQHNNMQPYLVLNFVIALQGIFPSQN